MPDKLPRQANPFGDAPAHSAESSLEVLLTISEAAASDHVLDVACGPGIVSCAIAPRVASIRGLDAAPELLERAKRWQTELDLSNVTWDVGDPTALDYEAGSFDLVVTRFSFHHLGEPVRTLREMVRVCKLGGRLVVADVAPSPATSRAFDEFETIRDPSHTHALTEPEFEAAFAEVGLPIVRRKRYGLTMPLETQLAASFPGPERQSLARTRTWRAHCLVRALPPAGCGRVVRLGR